MKLNLGSKQFCLCFLLFFTAVAFSQWNAPTVDGTSYAIVVKESTYAIPEWQEVVDSLAVKHSAQIFFYTTNISETLYNVSLMAPDYMAFVTEWQDATASFVSSVWVYSRSFDEDVYGDVIWGILTGYEAEDALRIATGPDSFDVKTVLGGTTSCDLSHYPQGISTSEATYCRYYTKDLNDTAIVEHNDGPTDRTEWLVECLNADSIDIFITSGHGAHHQWQLHYPSSGEEGYFRSPSGQAVGDPKYSAQIGINSTNPKIYFGLGNCNIGQIASQNSMALGWLHTAGACFYTGYVIPEGSSSHQHGGTKAYFERQVQYTWSQAYFLANQALMFDILNSTPGANPPDLNGSAIYGDPAMEARIADVGVYAPLLYTEEVLVDSSSSPDTVTVRITMNIEGDPGYTSKWGYRHPAVLLPIRAMDIEILSHDCYDVVVTDNFVLLYIWKQGDPSLLEGATREVVFVCNRLTGIGTESGSTPGASVRLLQNTPNPFEGETSISVSLPAQMNVSVEIFDLSGRLVRRLAEETLAAGVHSFSWNTCDDNGIEVSGGIYLCRLRAGNDEQNIRMVNIR